MEFYFSRAAADMPICKSDRNPSRRQAPGASREPFGRSNPIGAPRGTIARQRFGGQGAADRVRVVRSRRAFSFLETGQHADRGTAGTSAAPGSGKRSGAKHSLATVWKTGIGAAHHRHLFHQPTSNKISGLTAAGK